MNIGVIGSGGREHALAWKLAQSPLAKQVFVLPGNGGTELNLPVNTEDFEALEQLCRDHGIELLVVGPEGPLTSGIYDHFRGSGIRVFGPSQDAARLEGSKIFAKRFMEKYGVATAASRSFASAAEARIHLEASDGHCVLKYDGLAAGKGVFVTSTIAEALDALAQIEKDFGSDAPILVEEKLVGQEISILGITDGESIQLLTPSQDHKQRFEGDSGPNTGGMGAFCPVPGFTDDLLEKVRSDVVEPTMAGIRQEGMDYTGVIYFGIMVTRKGPKLLEYNVRLGDPETEVVLPKLRSDLAAVVLSCFDGTLASQHLEFHPGFFVDVVLASEGYPGKIAKGRAIRGIENPLPNTRVFHAGTRWQDGTLVTNGGRVLNVVGTGASLEEAIASSYAQADRIQFEGKVCRTDIGRRVWRVQ